MIQWDIDFDYVEFENQLFQSALLAFTALQEKLSNEVFYSFAVISLERFQTVGYAANTEESLQRFAEERLQQLLEKDSNFNLTLEDIKDFYRLRIDKFAYRSHFLNETLSNLLQIRQTKVNALMSNNQQYLSDSGVKMLETYLFGDMEQVLGKVMTRLDSLNIFEKTNKRANITLELHFGETHARGRYNTTSMLNPPKVFEKFKILVKRQNELYEKILPLEDLPQYY